MTEDLTDPFYAIISISTDESIQILFEGVDIERLVNSYKKETDPSSIHVIGITKETFLITGINRKNFKGKNELQILICSPVSIDELKTLQGYLTYLKVT
jgi:hypothetical protein